MNDHTDGMRDSAERAQQHLPEELAAFAAGRALRLRIVRHAETEHNTNHLMQGWSDSPITARGRDQIAAVAETSAAQATGSAFCGSALPSRSSRS